MYKFCCMLLQWACSVRREYLWTPCEQGHSFSVGECGYVRCTVGVGSEGTRVGGGVYIKNIPLP